MKTTQTHQRLAFVIMAIVLMIRPAGLFGAQK